jgi:SNF2 family DNA or RNA helicase
MLSILFRAKDANIHAIELGRIKGQELSSKLREIYIQRKKEDVLADELPEKDEQIVFCEPSQLQKDLYEYILQLPDFVLMRESTGPCDCGMSNANMVPHRFLIGLTHYSFFYCLTTKELIKNSF